VLIRISPHVEPGLNQELEGALRVVLSRTDARATVNAVSATIYLNGLEEARALIDALHQAARRADPENDLASARAQLIHLTCLTQ
jgi:hypothetical protein